MLSSPTVHVLIRSRWHKWRGWRRRRSLPMDDKHRTFHRNRMLVTWLKEKIPIVPKIVIHFLPSCWLLSSCSHFLLIADCCHWNYAAVLLAYRCCSCWGTSTQLLDTLDMTPVTQLVQWLRMVQSLVRLVDSHNSDKTTGGTSVVTMMTNFEVVTSLLVYLELL